jgi:hypothetical protein
MRLSAEEFGQHVLKGVRADDEPFQAQTMYNPDGDCIEFLASPDSFVGERIDGLVTVYRSRESGEIVGSLIKGVKRFLERHKNLLIVVSENRVRIDHLLISQIAATGQQMGELEIRVYQKLVRMAVKSGAEADLVGATGS